MDAAPDKNTPQNAPPGKRSALSSLGRGLVWTASALLPFPLTRTGKGTPLFGSKKWRLSWKKTGVYIAAWWLFQPASALLFPNARTAVAQAGLPAAAVAELAPGKNVHIRTDNLPGKLDALFDRDPVGAPFMWFNKLADTTDAAYTNPSVSPLFNNVCAVYIKSPAADEKVLAANQAYVEAQTRGKYTYELPVSGEALQNQTLLHEIRHCSDANQALDAPILKEADSDAESIEALARATGDPSLRQAFLTYLAEARMTGDHDTVLYVDARQRGVAPPTADEMNEANTDAAPFEGEIRGNLVKEDCAGDKCDAQFLADEYQLPPLTARRLELYTDALKSEIVPNPKPAVTFAQSKPPPGPPPAPGQNRS